ncbi:hypothetical protein Back11_32410 [Paenibacillus baekrokdamisoli]|uniref:Prolipoprotein diacylglyceryl transferase n=2 Tax=Paenibacillus baekrokdamisoli TaxID=1712516 RepID=A0A3G9IU35_9BACL|nr:hypothetical protein [Paenibacillus baekrokdamisoli]BBH21896.1 hypothetical protein Back11_32410 [Paenibacillus baekrokdamisoli]
MPELLTLGTLRLDGILLTAILSAAVGFIALSIWLKHVGDERKAWWVSLWPNGCLLTLLCWKLAFLFNEPSMLWERPSSLILMRGSAEDAALGIMVALIYMIIAVRKRGITVLSLLDILPFAVLPCCIGFGLLWQNPYLLPYAGLFAALYVVLLRSPGTREAGSGRSAQITLLGAGLGGLLISLFAPYSPGMLPELTVGLTTGQWSFVGLSVLGTLLQARSG